MQLHYSPGSFINLTDFGWTLTYSAAGIWSVRYCSAMVISKFCCLDNLAGPSCCFQTVSKTQHSEVSSRLAECVVIIFDFSSWVESDGKLQHIKPNMCYLESGIWISWKPWLLNISIHFLIISSLLFYGSIYIFYFILLIFLFLSTKTDNRNCFRTE